MSKLRTWKRLFGMSAIAVLLGAGGVYAQSAQDATTGNPKANQTGSGSSGTMGGQSGSGTGATTQSGNTMGANATTQSGNTMGAGGQAASGSLSKSDRRLMTELAQANLAEIEAGRIAQEKTKSDQVRTFAQQMVDDHTKALQELQQLAQTKGVTLPTEADSKHKKMAQKLSALSGNRFDRRYMAQSGVGDHKKTHKLLQRIESRATDPDIKALAARLLPVVDQHLNTVQQLSASTRQGAGKTSSGTSGTSGMSGSSGMGTSGASGGSGGSGTSGTGTQQSKPGSY